MSFPMVGHTRHNIGVCFGCWSMKLCDKDSPTIFLFIKFYMDFLFFFNNFPFDQRGSSCQGFYKTLHFYGKDNLVLKLCQLWRHIVPSV